MRFFIIGLLSSLFLSLRVLGQLTVTQGAAMNLTPQQLVQNWLIGTGIIVTNATFNGSTALITSDAIGTYTTNGAAQTQLGLSAGVLMTSGKAEIAIGPNSSSSSGYAWNLPGDPDLDAISGAITFDRCIIEFDFIPMYDTLKFRYVFASDEFYNYCNSINDAFGFFLSGPGITGPYTNNAKNIALMPNSFSAVTINNVCNDNTSNWCNDPNDPTSLQNCTEAPGQYYEYDGLTLVFTATHVLIPCSTYHIKLAIADAVDYILDSGVFLERNSFNAVGLSIQNTFTVPSMGNFAIEGCSQGIISFVLPYPATTPYTINYVIMGTATNGVDYTTIPNFITIPAGQDSVALIISPFFDGVPEGTETVILAINQPSCTGGNIYYDTVRIHDNTTLVATAGIDDTICYQDTVTLSGQGTGGVPPYTYQWNVPNGNYKTVQVIPSTPGDFSYILLVTDACGYFTRDTILIHVKTMPLLLNDPPRDTLCSGATTNITLQSTSPSSTYSWTAENTSGSISGIGPGAGPVILQTPVHSLNVVDSVLYHIIPFDNGCAGPDSIHIVLVNPLPVITFQQPGSALCSGQTTSIPITSSVTGSAFSWTATCSNPNISGYGPGNGDTISQTLFNIGSTYDTVFYQVTPVAEGCTGPAAYYYVRVNPLPVINNTPMWDTLCNGETTNIILTASCPGVSFDWIASQLLGNVSGASSGSGGVIAQQLFNQLNTLGSVIYTITPYTSTCIGNDSIFQIFVHPEPHLINSPLQDTLCNGGSTALNLLSDVAGTGFTWNCYQPSGNITGWSNNTTPATLIKHTLTNNSFIPDSIQYLITPHANGCDGPVQTYTYIVYPTPDIYFDPTAQEICSEEVTHISLLSHVAGTSFSWTSPVNPNITGNQGGTGILIADTLINLSTTIETVQYLATPYAFGCLPGITQAVTLTVNPEVIITNSLKDFEQCNHLTTGIVLQSNLSYPVTYSWTALGPIQVTGYADGSGAVIAQTLHNSDTSDASVAYRVVAEANQCSGDTTLFSVTVHPTPHIALSPPLQSVCSGETITILLTSDVSGSDFTWTASGNTPGLSGFGPGAGNQIIQTLTITDFTPGMVSYTAIPHYSNCTGETGTARVDVRPVPAVSFSACMDTITLTTAQPLTLKGGIPDGGTYSGVAVTAGIFDPGVAGAGTHLLRYDYTNTFGCQVTGYRQVTVYLPVPFTCGDSLTDIRDLKKYPTTLIGTQCWMAANLNFGSQVISTQDQRDNCIPEKYCYNDLPALCAMGSALYQWDEMMRYQDTPASQGFCPPGWHVPSESEWQVLFSTYPPYAEGGAGAALKSSGFSGFNAHPDGVRFNNSIWKYDAFDPTLRSVLFWTSTSHGARKAYAHGLNEVVADDEFTPSVSLYPASRNHGFFLRCLKD